MKVRSSHDAKKKLMSGRQAVDKQQGGQTLQKQIIQSSCKLADASLGLHLLFTHFTNNLDLLHLVFGSNCWNTNTPQIVGAVE